MNKKYIFCIADNQLIYLELIVPGEHLSFRITMQILKV